MNEPKQNKLERILEHYGDFDTFPDDGMLRMTDYDDCIAGVVQQYGRPPIICYDLEKVLNQLVREGMTYEEAEEWWNYNQLGAWMGDGTPCFIDTMEETE